MQYSIVSKKQIERSVFGDRIDAEFYLPTYLQAESIIEKHGFNLLNNITSKIDVGYVGSMVNEYINAGVWLLQTQNVKAFFLDESNKIFINQQFHEYLKKSKIRKGDILIARSGSFGTASIYLENDEINSADIIIITPQEQLINPYYLVTYLNCSYGMNQLLRFASGGLQGHVNLTILENLKVCNIKSTLQNHIEQTVKESYIQRKNSEQLTANAQAILLAELGLSNWKPKHHLSFVKNYSNTEQAERIDAEFFQPKYDELIEIIKSTTQCKQIRDIANFNARGLQPKYNPEGQIKVVNSQHILDDHLDYDNFERTDEQSWDSQKKARIFQNDILIYTTGANIGRANVYLIKDKCIASNHVNILRLEKENQIYVGFVMNSIIGRLQTQKYKSGAAQAELYPSDMEEFIVPFAKEETQNRITELVMSSFDKKIQSKALLNLAKRAVEIAIEQDEDAAVKWLQEQKINKYWRES